jgi:nicotinamide phosphoribosyltransferase
MQLRNQLQYNFILDADSYKLSHRFVYPKNITGMFSYIEPRIAKEIMIPVGIQMWIQKVLTQRITIEMIDEAEAFAAAHGEPFERSDWEYIIEKYDGFIPITIRAVAEGTPVPSQNALVTIECDDPRVFWLASYTETCIQRAVWYPTTIASNDFKIKKSIIAVFNRTGADMANLPFMLHDFGGRGVSSEESAQIGGLAHLVNFMGSDTISGVRAANFYYDIPMSAFSVPASEHTIQTAFGSTSEQQVEYLRAMIRTYGKPNAILSIVIDGYDTFREAAALCTILKDEIVASGAKVVFRPDSGDPLEIVPALLKMQAEAFGYDVNELGYKKIRTVGIIQGDGVDALTIDMLLLKIANMGYRADNIVFGSGGALLQKVNRDTYKFAQKASAIRVNGEWIGISKDPITDPGKKSKAGVLTLVRSTKTGEYRTVERDKPRDEEWVDQMQVVYSNGQTFNRITFEQIRANTGLW